MARLPRRRAASLTLARLGAALALGALAGAGCRVGAGDGPAATAAAAERLAALPYATHGAASGPGGVRRLDAARAQPGRTLVVAFAPDVDCMAELVDLDGRVVRCWPPDGTYWLQALLLPEDDLVVIGKSEHRDPRYSYVSLWGSDGTRRWLQALPVHHDIEPARDDDGYLVLLRRVRWQRDVSPDVPVVDNAVARLSPDGRVVEERSLARLLEGLPLRLTPVPRPELSPSQALAAIAGHGRLDYLHANSVAWIPPELVGSGELYGPDSVLVCLRHQDMVVVFDWRTRDVKWSWGPGVVRGPHDASWLPSGNVLLYDNGLGRDWGRVVEVDPRTDRVVWEYRDPSLYTATRGSAQRLPNGNTLITVAEAGRLMEVTPDGDVVWELVNPFHDAAGRTAIVQQGQRFPAGPDAASEAG